MTASDSDHLCAYVARILWTKRATYRRLRIVNTLLQMIADRTGEPFETVKTRVMGNSTKYLPPDIAP